MVYSYCFILYHRNEECKQKRGSASSIIMSCRCRVGGVFGRGATSTATASLLEIERDLDLARPRRATSHSHQPPSGQGALNLSGCNRSVSRNQIEAASELEQLSFARVCMDVETCYGIILLCELRTAPF